MQRTILAATIAAGITLTGVGTAQASTSPTPTTTTTTTTTTVTTTVTTTTTAPVVRRKSVVTGYASVAGYANQPGYGWVNIMVQTRHWTGKAYASSALSPVQIQRLVGRTWRTVLTVQTDLAGLAYRTIIAPSGRQTYRLVRPEGATVTAATSPVMTVAVPSRPGC